MNDRLQALTVFVRVGESGSFTRAAHDMNLSQPSVSRIIGELEARLGVKLLLRTTRRLTLTAAGEKFLERARDVLADLDEAEDAARGVDSLRGTLRVALPVVFGMREVIPRLPGFLARHPLLRVELRVSDAYQDLIAEGVDVAIRLGKLADSTFGARRLATLPKFVVAAPAYLETRGVPRSPAELAKHDCIFGPNGLGRESWTFKRRNTVISVDVTGRICTDSGPGLHASTLAGLGIARASAAMCGTELRSGALVALLTDYTLEPVDVHAVFPGGPHPSTKVRAFTDYMMTALHTGSPALAV
ncbi:LysR substrate-binding domain-containing protein [Rhodanobacter sp. Si-c]|uniref:LysR substrate-binding domain-containing protein n=1 Tax=Rhodanobacter lycopersici TaxID=3162487 RepID=A0ABV3QEK2_9GAMM